MAGQTQSLFVIADDQQDGTRRFVRVVPRDPAGLVEALAARVRDAYFDAQAALTRLRQAAAELIRFDGSNLTVSDEDIEQALEDELDAVLPAEWKKDRPRQTATQRSELAEIVATEVVTTLFGTVVPASRIASKEVPDQQTRGVDVLGIEGLDTPELVLIIGEVKGSCEPSSPPGVVADMATKLTNVTSDQRQIRQELIWLRDHASPEYAQACTSLCSRYLLRKVDPKIILTPILLRTTNTEKPNDYGRFKAKGSNFSYPVRFIYVIVDVQDLFDLALSVYKAARKLTEP